MQYGDILTRAWRIIWENKFLILLGVIVALGSGNRVPSGNRGFDFDAPRWEPPQWDVPEIRDELGVPVALIVLIVLMIASVALLVGITIWIVSTIARGGLIAGASTIDGGGTSRFAQAWSAGWERGWRLLGIGILPAIPTFLLFISGLGAAGMLAGVYGLLGEEALLPSGAGLAALFGVLSCILLPISLVLNLLQTFANRACVLEDRGVIGSYRRGLNVLVQNIGPALVLFLLQIVLSIVLGVAFFLPGLVMVVCCILWPLLLALQGAVTSYFSTMWTLAWREWTGMGHTGEVFAPTTVASEG